MLKTIRVERKVANLEVNRLGLRIDYTEPLNRMLKNWCGRIPVVYDEYFELDEANTNLRYAHHYNDENIVGFALGFDDTSFDVMLNDTGIMVFERAKKMCEGKDPISKIGISSLYSESAEIITPIYIKLRLELYKPDDGNIQNEAERDTSTMMESNEFEECNKNG